MDSKEIDMTMRRIFLKRLSVLLAGVGFAAAAVAHHGWTWYAKTGFTLSGKVVETHFGHPHDRLVVKADGQLWNLILSPPGRSARAGLSPDSIHVGDTITAYGHRHEDPTVFEMKTDRIRIGKRTFDLYPAHSDTVYPPPKGDD
jgi:Family of unknown function (DUF6152)